MPAIPEGAKTVTGEGRDLATAIAAAAESLGVEPTHVGHKLDLAHFRSQVGGMVAKQTVKIIAWEQEPSDDAETIKAPPRGARRDDDDRKSRSRDRDRDDRKGRGRDRDRDDRKGRDRDRDDRPPREERKRAEDLELEETAASAFAKEWLEGLVKLMDLDGTVEAGQAGDEMHIKVIVDRAGRMIGKRGSTLRSIRRVLKLALANADHGELHLEFDVDDPNGGKKKKERRDDRDDDRRDRKGRGRDRKRGGRGGDRDKGGYPEEKLVALATRAAEKAVESGKAITINLELNSYDRRIVHVAVAEIDGVMTVSEERDDGVKVVKVVPELGADDESEESDE